MPKAEEYFVLVPSRSPRETPKIWGPFCGGIYKSQSPRKMAEIFSKKNGGTVLGPFDPKKRPAKGRVMSEEKTPNTPAMIDHMLKELEQPKKKLTAWELGFIESIAEQFEKSGRLSARQFEILERIWSERV
jgi:hypothetical protein